MRSNLFSQDARSRIEAARSLPPDERTDLLRSLAQGSPYQPWPRGMPSSVNPLVVVLGVSPGNSPAASGGAFLSDYTPTFGEPAPGFRYRDSSSYWDKVRILSTSLLRTWDPSLTEDECIALTGHLNLGTGMFGLAGEDAVEPDVVRWVSSVIAAFRARVVVGLGLVGLLTARSDRVRDAWNGGVLQTDWTLPKWQERDGFRFRHFIAQSDETPVHILLWPNHPSRVPFTGPPRPGGAWERSTLAAAEIVRSLIQKPNH